MQLSQTACICFLLNVATKCMSGCPNPTESFCTKQKKIMQWWFRWCVCVQCLSANCVCLSVCVRAINTRVFLWQWCWHYSHHHYHHHLRWAATLNTLSPRLAPQYAVTGCDVLMNSHENILSKDMCHSRLSLLSHSCILSLFSCLCLIFGEVIDPVCVQSHC